MSADWKEFEFFQSDGYRDQWVLSIDFQVLRVGDGEAFSVERRPEGKGVTWGEYTGILKAFDLPSGVEVQSLVRLLDCVLGDYQKLTLGFETHVYMGATFGRWTSKSTFEWWRRFDQAVDALKTQ